MANRYGKYTKEDKKAYAKKKQREAEDTLNTIYNIAATYTINPDMLTEYINFSNSVYQYSPRNQILIKTQLPHASMVQSKSRWEEMGYHIRPEFLGAGAVVIRPINRIMYMDENREWKPLAGSGRERLAAFRRGELTTKEEFHYWARTASAFDITMTDCPPEDYPQLFYWGEKRLEDHIMIDILSNFAEKELGCSVKSNFLVGVYGSYNPELNEITLSHISNDTKKLSTLTHELGHAFQYLSSTDISSKSTARKEIEADCYSILISSRLGLKIEEGRKIHLNTYYKKFIKEEIDNGRYNPDEDLLGSKNPFFSVMREVKNVYQNYIPTLDSYFQSIQGELLYYTQLREQAANIRLLSSRFSEEERTAILTDWKFQFSEKIEAMSSFVQFNKWLKENHANLTQKKFLEELQQEIDTVLSTSAVTPDITGKPTAFILQLSEIPENREYFFRPFQDSCSCEQYDFIHCIDIPEQNSIKTQESRLKILEQLFMSFNSEYMPKDFIGHSLSVSDVVVLYHPETERFYSYYCNPVGFIALSDNFLSTGWKERLSHRFTVKEELFAYQHLKDSGYDISVFAEYDNYFQREYSQRIMAQQGKQELNMVSIVPDHIFESRYSLGSTPFLVFLSADNNIYLGHPDRIITSGTFPYYDNSDGSLIHIGTEYESLNLYRNDITFGDVQDIWLQNGIGRSRQKALEEYRGIQEDMTLSQLTETKPLQFAGIQAKLQDIPSPSSLESALQIGFQVVSPEGKIEIYSNERSALAKFVQIQYDFSIPREINVCILSDMTDVPTVLTLGKGDSILTDDLIATYRNRFGAAPIPDELHTTLDSISDLVINEYTNILALYDSRHEHRDFKLEKKVSELMKAGKIPIEMEETITDHSELICRRLTAMDKNNEFYSKNKLNADIFTDDDLYLTAIERTLNADKALHPAGCCQIDSGILQWTPWYSLQEDLPQQPGKEDLVIKKPYVIVHFSENDEFNDNEKLLLKDAQKKFARIDNEILNSDRQGYDKTHFSLYLPSGSVITDRYDLGDGYGGLIEMIDKTWAFGLDYEFEHGDITQSEYDKEVKDKNLLLKNLWNSIDLQYAEQYQKENNMTLAKERLSRIEGRDKFFKEHGQAGELDFQEVPKIQKSIRSSIKNNPIKTNSQTMQEENAQSGNIDIEQ